MPEPDAKKTRAGHPHPSAALNRLQLLLNASGDLVCTFDREGCFLEVGRAAECILGYPPEEMIGRHYLQLVFPADSDKTVMEVKRMQAGNNQAFFQNRFMHKDGTLVHLAWSATWDEAAGEAFCIGRNLNEHKKYEAEEARYKLQLERSYKSTVNILESITDGFIMINRHSQVTYWNQAAERLMGKRREEVLNKNIWHCFPEAVGTTFYQKYHATLRQQAPLHYEALYEWIDKWLEVNTYPSDEGLTIYFRDITDRKQAEEAIRSSEKSYRLLFNNLSLPTWIYDRHSFQFLDVNKAALQHYGYTRDEFLQLTVLDIRPAEDREAVRRAILAKKDNPALTQGCWTHRKKSGELIKVEISSSHIDYQGRPANLITVLDVTEKTQLQERLVQDKLRRQQELTRATIEAQESERSAIGRELHDNVNQVLTTVKLYNELCLTNAPVNQELLQKSVHYLNNCIQEIRNLSKALSEPTLSTIYLHDSVNELLESIRITNRLHIRYEAEGIEGKAFSKELHLAVYRIIQEQFTNILRHSGARQAHLSLVAKNQVLTITLSDDGHGFDTGRERQGIGITNMINRTQLLNGHLSLTSAPGQGCTLTATFSI